MYAKIIHERQKSPSGAVIEHTYVGIEDEFGNVSDRFRLDGGKRIDHLCEVKEEPEGVSSFTCPLGTLDESGLTKCSRFVAFQFQGPDVGGRLFLVVPAPAEEKWARLDDGPALWETWKKLPAIKMDRRWWIGNVKGERAWPTKVPNDVVPDNLGVYQISLFRFEWPLQRGNGGLISVPVCVRRQSDIDAEAEYYHQSAENYAKSGLPQAQGIVTNLLYAIQSFEASFNKTPEERDAWELVKERLCFHLAHLQQEAEAVLYGQCYVVHARDVLENKCHFFGQEARLEHPEQADPDLMCYNAMVREHGDKEGAEIMRSLGAGLLFEDFAPPEGKRTN